MITSSSNGQLKDLEKLSRRKERYKRREFLLEGPVVMEEVFSLAKPKKVFVSEKGNAKISSWSSLLEDENIPLIRVEEKLLHRIVPTENTQGVVGIYDFLPEKCIEGTPLLFIDGISDPGNLGGIFRSAEAFGVQGILIGEGTVDPYNPKSVRSAMGSIFRVPFRWIPTQDLPKWKERGYRIAALDLQGTPLYDYDEERVIYAPGNEAHGLSPGIKEIADDFIHIPMEDGPESLNANVALSIVLYEHRRKKGLHHG